jgi:hypothetical protein|nr:MAG TPA_asm: hypothetical protein [Caudoviricetes sp.]
MFLIKIKICGKITTFYTNQIILSKILKLNFAKVTIHKQLFGIFAEN